MRIIKKVISFIFSRLFLVAVMILVQLLLITLVVVYFSQSVSYLYIFNLISFLVVVGIISNTDSPHYKLTWVVFILIMPLTGWLFYLLLGNQRIPKKLRKQIDTWHGNHGHLPDNLCEEHFAAQPQLLRQSRYIYNLSGYPLYPNTASEYFPLGELMFERMMEKLCTAERYIFLEYFIISPGYMWDTLFAVLKERVAAGVEVRLMYDDIGSISTMPSHYNRLVVEAGIKLCVFNPFRPRVSMLLNYRDHRKICVIDGEIAFCGGINIADEYINRLERFGHWKDTGVMLQGEAVWSFTFMFLQQWQFSLGEPIDFDAYRPHFPQAKSGEELVQVFGDSPLDKYNVTEIAYMNIISRATRYVYITTPYLVIDSEMETALCTAAQSGVDVRIITPSIYDKWYVHLITRSHYSQLIKAGVKVYEYTPGFMHGKVFVSDDDICMVGTCNMDFRSFYLHFECTVAFFQSQVIESVKQDMLSSQQASRLITLEDTKKISLPMRIVRAFIKIFAPLL